MCACVIRPSDEGRFTLGCRVRVHNSASAFVCEGGDEGGVLWKPPGRRGDDGSWQITTLIKSSIGPVFPSPRHILTTPANLHRIHHTTDTQHTLSHSPRFLITSSSDDVRVTIATSVHSHFISFTTLHHIHNTTSLTKKLPPHTSIIPFPSPSLHHSIIFTYYSLHMRIRESPPVIFLLVIKFLTTSLLSSITSSFLLFCPACRVIFATRWSVLLPLWNMNY